MSDLTQPEVAIPGAIPQNNDDNPMSRISDFYQVMEALFRGEKLSCTW